jgi:hypothetical protein
MHVLLNKTPLPFIYGETLQPGEWLMQDDHAFILAAQAPRGTASVRPWLQPEGGDRDGVLILRSGAIGDLLLASPAIKSFTEKRPLVYVCCLQRHFPIVGDAAHGCIEYPLPVAVADRFERVISLEGVIEDSTDKGIHAVDAFAAALGATVTDYRPVYAVTDAEKERAPTRTEHRRLGVHLRSSSAIRDYPLEKWFKVLTQLSTRKWEIFLLGSNTPTNGLPWNVKDCSRLPFREAAAILSTCDVFAGVDSSFFNLCPALGVPAVGLFGPVDWRTRIKEGSGQLALHGGGCEPCHWTSPRMGKPFPSGKPCTAKGCCVLLDSIGPNHLVAKIEALAKPCA